MTELKSTHKSELASIGEQVQAKVLEISDKDQDMDSMREQITQLQINVQKQKLEC